MANGVTHFGSKIRNKTRSRQYYDHPMNFGYAAKLGTGATAIATGEGSSGSGLGGLIVASTDELDTLFKVPSNFDATATSYVDVLYYATGAATSVDGVTLVGTYKKAVEGTAAGLGDATTATGVTDPGTNNPALNGIERGTHTIAPSTLAAGDVVHWQTTVLTTCTEKELRIIPDAIFRYAKDYV